MSALVLEPVATSCNILSNAVVLHTVCRDPLSPLPTAALALQVVANAAWVCFAALARDAYLLATALTSLCLQLTSLALKRRHARPDETRRPIRLDVSSEELPRGALWEAFTPGRRAPRASRSEASGATASPSV